ncbi:MAG TPA: hypothetical protein VFC54_01385 [Pseudolabrys sp.]|nr:hypothetical protein [Pseudolabrys sp.]
MTAEDDATIHEADQEITEESKRKIPVVDIDTVMQQAPRYRNWLPHDKKYFEGDTRHADDIRRDVKKNRIAAEGKLDIATQSPRKVEDALRSGMASLRSHAEKGKPITSGLLQGYTVDNRGEFQRNLHPSITFPEDWSKPTQFSDDLALVDNALDVSIWANFDSYVAAMTKQVMEEATDDANAISDAERPQMIAAAKAELLAAQHAEESANVMCELAGIPVFRPYDWPVIVLLQVEAPPKAKNVSRAPVVPAPVKDADLEFEDADAGDDE